MGADLSEQDLVSGQGNTRLSQPAHALSFAHVLDEIGANRTQGLTDAEAKKRVEEHGRNELESGGGVQPVKILIRQIANAMILVMLTTSPFSKKSSGADPNELGTHPRNGGQLRHSVLDRRRRHYCGGDT